MLSLVRVAKIMEGLMFYKLGVFSYRARWWIVAAWLCIIVMAGVFAPQANGVLKSGGFNLPEAESIKAINDITERFGGYRATIMALFTPPSGTRADDPTYMAQVDAAVAGAKEFKDIKAVLTYGSTGDKSFISGDGKYTYALFGFVTDVDATEQNLASFEKTLKPGNLDMRLTGLPVIYKQVNEVSQTDLEQAEKITLPLALIILVIVFRTLVAAAMPIIVAMCSVATTLAMIYFLGQTVDLSIFVLNIATVLGLGIGIDYSLFIVNRFREELHKRDGDVESAIAATVGSAGRATFFSGLTVLIGMSSLLLFQFMALRSMGIGGVLVVLMSVLASLSMLPAILSILGHRIDSLKVPFLKRTKDKLQEMGTGNSFWHKLAEFVMRHPIKIIVVVLAILVLVGSPFWRVRFGEPQADILPKDNPARVAFEIIGQNFPGSAKSSDVYLLVEAKNGKMTDPENVTALVNYTNQLIKDKQVKGIRSAVNLPLPTPLTQEQYVTLLGIYGNDPSKLPAQVAQLTPVLKSLIDNQKAVIKLDTGIEYASADARQYINSLRGNKPANFNVLISGEQPALMDFVDKMYSDFPIAILLVVIITYITLLIMFKSVLLPLKAVVMTALSLSASYGALVWLLQDGNLSTLLDFKPTGYVESMLPIMMFGILSGLSMDYEVFLLTRIKEVYDETKNNTKSVALGLERTGGIITSAALIMIVVSAAFATADIIIIKAIGIGMALAVFIDATIIRALLVPATMKLIGDWNWWIPKALKRLLPDVNIKH